MNITSLSSLLSVALALGVFLAPTFAEPGYECFRPDERVRSVFFHHGRISSAADDPQRVWLAQEAQAVVEVTRNGEATMLSVGASCASQVWSLPVGERLHLVRVLAGQLNDDSKSDLVVELTSQGNGLAANLSTIVILLSVAGGFQAVAVDTYNFESQSFVVCGSAPIVQFIQTLFVQAQGTDAKEHSFWVHRLWSVRNDGLELNEAFSPRFYQFTHRPNQEETQVLNKPVRHDVLSNLNWKPMLLHALP
jgi:hypothetical protein